VSSSVTVSVSVFFRFWMTRKIGGKFAVPTAMSDTFLRRSSSHIRASSLYFVGVFMLFHVDSDATAAGSVYTPSL